MSPEDAYTSIFPALFRYFYYRNISKEETEDLAQETFLRFFKKYDSTKYSLEECRKITYGIASNVYKEWLRSIQHTSNYELHEDFPLPDKHEELCDDTSEEYLEKHLPLLHAAIDQLAPTLKQVITLRFIEGLTRKEVAERLNTKEKYVHIYQQRAIKSLQKILGTSAVSPSSYK